MSPAHPVAAIVPCHNEEATVAGVVADLQAAVPGIVVYVYDNCSTDATAAKAHAAGAVVRTETHKGKGNVIRRAFADVDAEAYVVIDGDGTYDASAAAGMVTTLQDGPYDQVLGVRRQTLPSAYRPGHATGNRVFNALVGWVFGEPVTDMLSGYRVLSRRFVKSFPTLSKEFEIETELTVHAINTRVPQIEVPVYFRDRPDGSESKLRTYHDGIRILGLILRLTRYERPLPFHGVLAGLLLVVALALGVPIFVEFVQTGLVPRFPTAILASSIVVIAVLLLVIGLILEALRRVRDESARMAYLRFPAPGPRP